MRLALVLLLAAAACANPVPPTGGPEDRTPPALVATVPEAGAVNVAADAVELTFSEYVSESAFRQALSVTPAFEQAPEVTFRGRRATVAFPEPLRPNTTYILTLDTGLRDLRSVAIAEPLVLAFSTGPTINRGQIAGRVVGPERGAGRAGVDVYAYAADAAPPAPLPEAPAYRTQTGPDGTFTFDYLTEGPYYIVALADRNRNRAPDPGEPFAVPPRPLVTADTLGTPVEAPWIVGVVDTTGPTTQRVQPLSRARLAVRFSEPVRLTARDGAAWSVADSLSGAARAVRTVYTTAEAPTTVYLVTEPLAPGPYRLRPGAVVDTSGNPAAGAAVAFVAPDAPDTLRPRFVGFGGPDVPAPLLPDEAPTVRFTAPVPDSLLRAAVTAEDTTGTPLAVTAATDDGTTYRLAFDPPLTAARPVQVAVRRALLGGPDSTAARRFERLAPRDLGGRAGVVAAPDATGVVVVELYRTDAAPDAGAAPAPFVTTADSTGRYRFPALPPGTYRLRAFVDRDGDRAWDPGRTVPYVPAEPLVWGADSLAVQARWEREAPDTLRFRP